MHLRRRSLDLLRETRTSLISCVGLLCVAGTPVLARDGNIFNILFFINIFLPVCLAAIELVAAHAAPVGGHL